MSSGLERIIRPFLIFSDLTEEQPQKWLVNINPHENDLLLALAPPLGGKLSRCSCVASSAPGVGGRVVRCGGPAERWRPRWTGSTGASRRLGGTRPGRASDWSVRIARGWQANGGCGSRPLGSHFGVAAPPILEPILVRIGMFTGGTGF